MNEIPVSWMAFYLERRTRGELERGRECSRNRTSFDASEYSDIMAKIQLRPFAKHIYAGQSPMVRHSASSCESKPPYNHLNLCVRLKLEVNFSTKCRNVR